MRDSPRISLLGSRASSAAEAVRRASSVLTCCDNRHTRPGPRVNATAQGTPPPREQRRSPRSRSRRPHLRLCPAAQMRPHGTASALPSRRERPRSYPRPRPLQHQSGRLLRAAARRRRVLAA